MRPRRMLDAGSLGRLAASALAALTLVACNSSSAPVQAFSVSAVSGGDQYATIGAAAPNPLVVVVMGDNAAPFAGAPVHWAVTSGGGTVSDSVTTSDATGHAQVTYTAGSQAGTAKISAKLDDGFTATFVVRVEATATAVAAPVAGVSRTSLASSLFNALHR